MATPAPKLKENQMTIEVLSRGASPDGSGHS